ncbi:hypothetical protein Rt10032_c01g0189 [Rhodotorula toruloides]|uniref:Uncharacterized protein n=1 Tax=Rhodotorula toruloides TaxID=5286 RepID=A0A511K752_RHOTO|nr:hypothetical protein Rt10032_c01g0189 [Rhodotorula toruloides]
MGTATLGDPLLSALVTGVGGATPSPALPSLAAAFEMAVAENATDVADQLEDPLLAALPAFTYAMPVQVVILGVTLTLIAMLLVHLLFTIRYHAPLSKANYILQTTAAVLSLCNTAAQLRIVMHDVYQTGRERPFMFDYIEVSFPKDSWGTAQRAAWLLLQGLNALAVHATHIQFLTMLFPSALEVRLIFFLLGPLALATAGLVYTTMSVHPAVNDLGDAIRNTCNSSLTLLYTLALWIWGLTLNRSRAWRTEGGTASFGIVALVLGVLGTAVNFVEIKEDRMRWLPGVVTCILLWQSWVGFWWWVGAGMWAGEAEDVERRRDKQRRKEEKRQRKKEQQQRRAAVEAGERTAARSTVSSLRRRFGRTETLATDTSGEAIELLDLGGASAGGAEANPAQGVSPTGGASEGRRRPIGDRDGRSSDSNSSTLSSSRPSTQHFYDPLLNLFVPFLARLRLAHDAAAVAQAAKPPGLPEEVRRGWGIRAMMMRGRKERGERRQAARGRVRPGAEMDASERRAGFELDGGARLGEDEECAAREGEEEWEDEGTASTAEMTTGATSSDRRPARSPQSMASTYPPTRPTPSPAAVRPPCETGEEPAENWAGRGMEGQSGWWWRGWIGRWRLQDVSRW